MRLFNTLTNHCNYESVQIQRNIVQENKVDVRLFGIEWSSWFGLKWKSQYKFESEGENQF